MISKAAPNTFRRNTFHRDSNGLCSMGFYTHFYNHIHDIDDDKDNNNR